MFTQPCFIRKNTPELRKKLEELGYNRHPSYGDDEYLYLNRGFYHTNVVGYSEEIERMIDCGTNEELFLALAALRNDSDYMQWFVNKNGYFEMCFNDKVENYLCGYGVRKYRQIDETYHKVTVKEIVEHFNKK